MNTLGSAIFNPQRMREGYSSQSCLWVYVCVCLLQLFQDQHGLLCFNFSLNDV